MAYNVPAGELRHLITIQQRVEVVDTEYGGSEQVWSDFTVVRAKKIPVTGKESAATSQAIDRWVIRYKAGITSSMRVLHNGAEYKIISPPRDLDGLSRWLEIVTELKGAA